MALDVLDVDIGGTTDANGNLTLSQVPSPAYWCNLKVVAQVGGSPIWVVQKNQRAVTFGRGGRVDLGPILAQPRDQIAVQVIGAQASSALTGRLIGITGQLAEVIANFVPSPNTIALDTSSPAILLDRIDTAGGSGTKFYPIPPGIQSVALAIDVDATNTSSQNRSVLPSFMQIRGYPSGDFYIGTPLTITATTFVWSLINPNDTKISVQWTSAVNALNTFIDVLVSPSDLAGRQQDTQGNLLTSMANALPAPWQAAFTSVTTRVAPGALNTDFTIASGVAGQRIYVHGVVVNTNAGGTWEVDLWDGPSVNGLKVADFLMDIITAVGASPPVPWEGHGRQLGIGNALIGTLVTGGAGSTIFGTYGISQA